VLRALLHNKDRSINLETENKQIAININYREIYPQTEDFFTAAVFSRLCYLEGKIIAEIFSNCVGKDLEFGDLIDRQFWPSWKNERGSRVEPDVFMIFENCDVIIEAKRYDDFGQEEEQIKKELEAYFNLERYSNVVYLFAMGGVSENFKNIVDHINLEKKKAFEIIPISWQSLHDNIKNADLNNKLLKEDLLWAFELQGIRELLFLKDLNCDVNKKIFLSNYEINLYKLNSYSFRKPLVDSIGGAFQVNNYEKALEVLQWK